ncbi:hypothetical protein SAMN05216197_11676 [Pseudomonas graminis]|uniref:Uncharacterized protein n=1 Tax=Pseudomonas graminis TaxID=158627 RepID=A0A1I0FDH7_9PSED|nr:hypothetical protein SAMN05216197_11676 [Pseudomonas graminis]
MSATKAARTKSRRLLDKIKASRNLFRLALLVTNLLLREKPETLQALRQTLASHGCWSLGNPGGR